jgi:hypothetical protein
MIGTMRQQLQRVTHNGELVAVVIAGQAIIDDTIPAAEKPLIQAKCLYALEIQAGDLPGPYTDEKADLYARTAARLRR